MTSVGATGVAALMAGASFARALSLSRRLVASGTSASSGASVAWVPSA